MKILKIPFETTIKCECGCEFEFDCDDIEVTGHRIMYGFDYKEIRQLSIQCPVCKRDHELIKNKE